DGLYTADPHTDPQAKLIPFVHCIDDKLCALAGGTASGQGTGGMVTKLQAAKRCIECGGVMIITNGNHPENLYDILDGKTVGTTFTERK
ncbi:MAG: glutamate 5-kinase, partial [Clostridia bacterium]|nr:glutamate 5-kinase [Clostridia bacterium]